MAWRRDASFMVGGMATACAFLAAVATAGQPVLGPAVFEWSATVLVRNATGEVRQLTRGPTATLRELEMHVTTLNPGLSSHPPHRHPNEELVIIDRGVVETLSDGRWHRIGPGSVVFNASNAPHALRNVGRTPARYHVVNWSTAATPAE